MPDWLSIHEPVLVRPLRRRGDLRDAAVLLPGEPAARGRGTQRSAGSGRGAGDAVESRVSRWPASRSPQRPDRRRHRGLSFSVLSLLPAVLLHISLQSRRRAVWIGGYSLSGVAVALHLADWLDHVPGLRLKKIVRKAGAEYFLLDANEIFAFHAEGDIVWIATARKRYQATQTLKVLEERPLNASFQRIRRLVNW